MRRRITAAVFAVVLVSLGMLAGVTATSGAATTSPGHAGPANPAFLDYLRQRASGALPLTLAPVQAHGLGYIPSPVKIVATPAERMKAMLGAYPTSFDLRTTDPIKVTPVRDQGVYGTCWAFATLASLESTQLPGASWDFSEDHLVLNDGFDPDPYYAGGNADMSTAYLMRWSGPVNEVDDGYTGADHGVTNSSLPPVVHVQNVYTVPGRTSAGDNAIIKQMLTMYGGVYTPMYWAGGAYKNATKAYYYSADQEPNHAVTIVGWDDTYSHTNFAVQPPGNGAFIVKNSWGPSWGAGGYFYVSYYDADFAVQPGAVFTADPVDTATGIYQYDTYGVVGSWGYDTTTAWMADRFTARSSDSVVAVSLNASGPDTHYDLYIGTSLTDRTPIASGTLTFAGYQTVTLATPQPLTTDSTFYIIAKLTTPGASWPLTCERKIDYYDGNAVSHAGESWGSANGTTWTDVSAPAGQGLNWNLKAYTKYVGPPDSIAPVTTASDPGAGWSSGPVTITFDATDGDSGVSYTEWNLDGGAWTRGTQAVVSIDGHHTVGYRSVDRAGNVETTESLDVSVDVSAPVTAAQGVSATWGTTPVDVVLHASDAASGVARTDYTVDGVAASNTAGDDATFSISTEGNHTVTWQSTDNVGHVEALRTGNVRIDATAPSAAVAGATGTKHGSWYPSAPRLAIGGATDAVSGIARYEYKLDAGAWTTAASGVATITANGKHTLLYRAVDMAGNPGPETTLSPPLWIDTTVPVTKAPWALTTYRGRTTALPYVVGESRAAGISAYATIVVTNSRGVAVLRATIRNIALNKTLYYRFTCGLARGAYTYTVFAADAAGHTSSKVHNRLVVR